MIQRRFLTRFLSPYMFRGNGKFISKNLSLSLSLSLSFRGFRSNFKSYRWKALGRYSRLNRFINYTQQTGFFAVRNNNSWQAMNLDENKKISSLFYLRFRSMVLHSRLNEYFIPRSSLVPPSFLRNTIQGTGESKRCFDSTTREHRFPSKQQRRKSHLRKIDVSSKYRANARTSRWKISLPVIKRKALEKPVKGTRYGRTRSLLVTTSRVVLGARESSGHERNKGQRVRVIPQNELISSLPFFFLDIYLDSNTPIIRNYHLSIYSSIVFQSGKYSCE